MLCTELDLTFLCVGSRNREACGPRPGEGRLAWSFACVRGLSGTAVRRIRGGRRGSGGDREISGAEAHLGWLVGWDGGVEEAGSG